MLCRAGRGGDPGRDETERAARLFDAAEALREKVGTCVSWPAWRTLNEREVASVRELLDAETFDTAWMEGRVMAFEEAVAEGVLAGVLLLGENLGREQLIGAAIIFCGVYLGRRQ